MTLPRLGWRLLVLAAVAGVSALVLPLASLLPGWLRGGGGGARVALHMLLLAGALLLLRRGLGLRQRGLDGQAVLALGLLAAATLPYAGVIAGAIYASIFAADRV
jgi:hypothetical protein